MQQGRWGADRDYNASINLNVWLQATNALEVEPLEEAGRFIAELQVF